MTEFRQFLLYMGPVMLKDILNKTVYHNFLLISVGIHLLSHPGLTEEYLEYAHALLVSFVQHFGQLYGTKFLSYNVHNVVHLAEDFRKHGVLDNFSAFKFENYLQKLKKLVRKPQTPLSQIVRHLAGPLLQVTQYKEIKTDRFTLKLDRANCYMSIRNSTAKVHNIVSYRGETYIVFNKLTNQG